VLDFTAVIAGPVAGRTLAELGADVLRIDDPWFRPAWADGFHALFDRGKRSAWLDLQVPAEREVLERVVADLDPQLVLQNFRPGVAERLGLTAYADHVVSLSAFGTEGAWGRRPGWEQTVQAVAGIQSRYGGDAPELFPVPVHDLVTGLFGAYGALVTLFGGGGAHASLARTATWMLAHHTCGDGPADGAWEKRDDGWWFVAGDVAVPRTRPAAARAASARVRREHRDDLGTFTRIDAPLVLSHTPVVEGASRPRGWATQEVTDGQRPPATREVPGRRRWWAGRIRWGLGVAAVRLLP
jgi:crotonobetainyl-CoA:carnitine CoA-transferase CaiB-like acyl-CoA transferase